MNSSVAEFAVFVLRSILTTYRRMYLGGVDCETKPCKRAAIGDAWCDAIEEAIRCVEKVHGLNQPDYIPPSV